MTLGYRDIRLTLTKAGELIVIMGIKRSECVEVSVCGLICCVPSIRVEPECFLRLCRVNQIVPSVKRVDDFLHGEFRYRGFAILTSVWSKSSMPNAAEHWRVINAYSQLSIEVKRPCIGVKRPAIADKRRLIGLPAPKVIDV